jgi:Ca2+-binding RTX toxin-like protein
VLRNASDAPGYVVAGSAQAQPTQAVVECQTAIGLLVVMSASGVVVDHVDDPVHQSDRVGIGGHGAPRTTFTDGTTSHLRKALNGFVCETNTISNSDLFRPARGIFIAGKIPNRFDTPVARTPRIAQQSGVGTLTIVALIFSGQNEIQAASRQDAFLDDGIITYKDLEHGTYEIVTKEAVPRVIIVDDPGETIVLRRTGSGVSVSRITNTSDQMAALQDFYHQTDRMGWQEQLNGGPGSSDTPLGNQMPLDFQPAPLPINVIPDRINSPDTPTLNTAFLVPLIVPLIAPPTAPTIAIPAITITRLGNSGTSIVNANQADAGVPITGTTSGVENGRAVTIVILDGSNHVVYSGTTTVIDGTWLVDLSPTDARALADGVYQVKASVSDAAGHPAPQATTSVTIDTIAAPPTLALTTDSGSSGIDHITNSGALTLAGIETGAIIEYSSDGGDTWSSAFAAPEGANTVQVRQTDVARNVSSATTFSFTLDTVNPAAPGVALMTDSGSSGADQITSSGALTLSGIETDAIIEYSSDGGNTWSSAFTVLEGTNFALVRQTDFAGNVASATTFRFTLDTVNPAAPGVALMTDSGSSGTDHTTNNGALTLSGIETSAIIEYSSEGGNTWSRSFTAVEGANTVRVRQTDVAGNVSGAAAFSFTLDTVNPTVSVNIVHASLSDNDSSSQVTITFSKAPVGFTNADLTVVGGTLSTVTQDLEVDPTGKTYTAIFTATATFSGTGSVSVTAGSYADAAGNTGAAGSDSVTIDRDDFPTAQPDSNFGAEASTSGRSLNIVIVFDRSGSMSDDPNVNGFSERVDLARAAVANLLTGLDGAATQVNVLVVDFSSSAASSSWVSIDGANAYLAGLVAGGGTNYDAALAMAQAAFVTATPDADQNITLFLSDGVPTAGQEIGAADQAAWESFLTAHDMPAFAIGIGTGVTTAPLQPMAFDPAPGTQAADTPVVYGTGGEGALIDALSPLVIGSFLSSFSGDLLLNDQFGGDGAGMPEISTVSYASVSGSSLVFAVTSALDPLAPDTTQLTGSNGGMDYWRLDVNTATGDYDLTLLQNFPHSTPGGTATITFNYTIQDFDGDSSSSTLAVTIADVTTAIIAGLPQIAGDNSANTLNGIGVGEILGGDAGNDIVNGNGGDDFVFGGAGTDTLDGGLGNDLLVGGLGNDLLVGGPGSDTMTGGSGNDTFVYSSVDDSRGGQFDTITDLTSGDKIDLTAFDTTAFTNVTWDYNSANNETIVQVDTDGNSSTAGLEIHLMGNIQLTQSHFLFG